MSDEASNARTEDDRNIVNEPGDKEDLRRIPRVPMILDDIPNVGGDKTCDSSKDVCSWVAGESHSVRLMTPNVMLSSAL